MTKQHKLLSLAACMSAALVASSAMAAETPAAQTSAKEVLRVRLKAMSPKIRLSGTT